MSAEVVYQELGMGFHWRGYARLEAKKTRAIMWGSSLSYLESTCSECRTEFAFIESDMDADTIRCPTCGESTSEYSCDDSILGEKYDWNANR